MTAIAQALRSGHSTRNILKYLSQQNPELAQTISTALEAGHSIDHVVNFISRNEKKLGKLIPEKTQRDNPFKKIQTSIHPSLKGAAKAAAITAGAVGGGMALSRAVPSILQKGTVANAAQAASSVPTPSGSPQSPLPTNQNRMQSNNASTNPQSQPLSQQPPLSNVNAASITEPANIQQPKGNSSIVDKLYSGFEKGRDKGFDFESDAFLKVAKRMKSTGEIRSKEDFERFFNLFDAKKNEGKDLPTALKEASIEYDGQKLTPELENAAQNEPIPAIEEKISPEIDFSGMGKGMTDNLYNGLFESLQKGSFKFAGIEDPFLKKAKEPFEKGLIKSPDDLRKFANGQIKLKPTELVEENPAKAPKIEKNTVVSSPDGVGEVREIRGDKALVEIDGKLKKVDVSDLEPPLYSDDDIADAYDRLMAIIPEKERSGFISWAGYDENTNELGFIPRGGKYEVITDISPEEAKMIKEGTGTARTNGEVREGFWVAGGETRGGVISQIIHDRRRKKEAEEKKQGKFDFGLPKPEKEDRGMKPQFDEMAYARNLSRARDKRAKDEERARKKKEKDEAKKRKK